MGNFVFYSAVLSSIFFFGTYWFSGKNKGLAWVVTLIVALVVVFLLFPGAATAVTLGDIAENISLFLVKLIYLVAWFVPAAVLHWLLPDY